MPPKRKWAWKWTKKDIAYIEMMKEYENKNALGKKYSKKQMEVWREISMRVGMPANYCKRKWIGIKHNYLQIKYMIHVGRVTEDIVRKHIKTSKYLDGRLDFLDRFMFKIPAEKLSISARNFFDSVFGELPCTQSGSSLEKLIKVKENSVIEVIKDYKQETGIEPMSILPTIDIYESDSSSITHFEENFVNLGMDQAIKQVYQIDDDSNDEVFVEPDILPNIQISTSAKEEFVNLAIDQAIKEGYKMEDDLNDDIQFVEPGMIPNIQIKQEDPLRDNVVTNDPSSSILKDILISTNNEESSKKSSKQKKSENTVARFLVKYTTTTLDREKDKDCDLKQYMNDLAEVLCKRLVPGKRKYFLSQIDLIVSEMLEGT